MMRALPIRIRLTLWYMAMFSLAAALISLACVWTLKRCIDATEYHELQERCDDIQMLLNRETADKSPAQVWQDFDSIYSQKDDGKYLQVRDDHGNWIYRSQRMIAGNIPLPMQSGSSLQDAIQNYTIGIHQLRTLSHSTGAHGVHYTVQTGITMNKPLALLDNFRRDLLLLTPVLIVLAAFGGHFMSRKALRPVAVLAEEARRINDRRLDIRLPVSTATDEISHLSLTLNQMLQRIDKAFASIKAFTGNASHELRTPISLMRTEIEIALLRPRSETEYCEILHRLQGETERMTVLLDDLLALARADGGTEVIGLHPMDLASLFTDIHRSWNDGMLQAGLSLDLILPEHGVYVSADSKSLRRLLSILLDNAAKYTSRGGQITLASDVEKRQVRITVRDTGIGIPASDLPFIFDRFYRGKDLPANAPGGSGLGLSLARWIALQHGSVLDVSSEAGRGSSFSFLLPIVSHEETLRIDFGQKIHEDSQVLPLLQ